MFKAVFMAGTVAAGLIVGFGGAAHAALTITNGDFETGIADQSTPEDVTGWFDVNNGQATFFQHTWHDSRDAEVPTDSQSGLSGQASAAFSGLAGSGTSGQSGSWLYQSIGTDATRSSLSIEFDWGDFGNINGNLRDLGLTVSVYEYDGIGTFSAGDNADVEGQESVGGSGVTELDLVSISVAKLVSSGPAKLILNQVVTLDVSGQSGGELFLRFNNWDPGSDDPWLMVDNISIVPTPAALPAGLALLGAVVARRRR